MPPLKNAEGAYYSSPELDDDYESLFAAAHEGLYVISGIKSGTKILNQKLFTPLGMDPKEAAVAFEAEVVGEPVATEQEFYPEPIEEGYNFHHLEQMAASKFRGLLTILGFHR